jgi:protein-tyrosine phosphatase
MSKSSYSISFVCMGNICRSPTAEAVMRHLVEEAGLSDRIHIDSAGTGAWHVGEARDARSRAVGQRRGMPLSGVARQFSEKDFARFDYVLAMDRDNRRELLDLAPNEAAQAKVRLLRSFDPAVKGEADVPDPYYGGPEGFEAVFDSCLSACQGLLAELKRELAGKA